MRHLPIVAGSLAAQLQEMTMTNAFQSFPAGPRALRQLLLGAAAALTLSGSLGATSILSPAYAQSAAQLQTQRATAPVAIPGVVPSFADVIDRVKGAVVSVRVR